MESENLNAKIGDALESIFNLLGVDVDKHGDRITSWGEESEKSLQLLVINKLREFGLRIVEDEWDM